MEMKVVKSVNLESQHLPYACVFACAHANMSFEKLQNFKPVLHPFSKQNLRCINNDVKLPFSLFSALLDVLFNKLT